MQKNSLLVLILILHFSCIAQNRFLFFAGAQATSARYKIMDQKQETQYKFGLQAGIGWKIPFDLKLFFTPEIYYSLKGYKVTLKDHAFPPSIFAKNNNTTLHTIDIIPMLQYDFGNNPAHLFIKVGAGIDFVISGREKFDLSTGETIDQKMVFSFGDYGRLTSNAVVQFGYETAGEIMIFGHYTYGLGSLNNADGGPQIRHRIFGVSAGKYLNRKKEKG
jgi:outer membrane protein with beta-barrel domain